MKFYYCILLFLFGYTPFLFAQYTVSGDFTGKISFESGVPNTWTPDTNSTLSTATDRYKHGTQSLEWEWVASNSTLTVTDVEIAPNSHARNSGLQFWLYSEQAIQDSIHFVMYDTNNVILCDFYYKIDFEGWRGQWMRYKEELGKNQNTIIDRIEIIAPANTSTGKLWFDLVHHNNEVIWTREGSLQFEKPYGEDEALPAPKSSSQNRITYYLRHGAGPEIVSIPSSITPSMIADVELIMQRMDEYLLGSGNYSSNTYFTSKKNQVLSSIGDVSTDFNSLNITDNGNGVLSGLPIFGPMHKFSASSKFHPNVVDMKTLALRLAYDYRLNGTVQSKDDFIILMDYLDQQGWTHGSSMGSLHYMGLFTNDFEFACFLMRDVLKAIPWENSTKLDRTVETIFYGSNSYAIFAGVYAQVHIHSDDVMRGYNQGFWAIMMMDDNDINKYWYLNQFIARYEQVVLNPNIDSDVLQNIIRRVLRPDYTGYHHEGPAVSSYYKSVVSAVMSHAYVLRGTQFDFDANTKNTLKEMALQLRFMSQQYDFPKGITMRWSGHKQGRSMIGILANASHAVGSNGTPDGQLSAAFLRLWEPTHTDFSLSVGFSSLGNLEAALDLVENSPEVPETVSGFKIYPHMSHASWRNDNWLVSTKGYSKYVWNAEMCCSQNLHGGFDSNGQLTVLLENASISSQLASGLPYDNGYDWKYVPGATTLDLSISDLDDLDYWVKQSSTFVGGVEHKGTNGIWAMELDDNVNIIGNQFKKSVFYFGNNVMVHLGSDINNNRVENTVSTLFQLKIDDTTPSTQATYLNGNPITTFPYDNSSLTGSITMKDPYGNGYYVPDAVDLILDRQNQDSYHINNLNTTNGNWSKAYFNHGASPNDAGYEYVTLIQSDDTEIATFASNPPYEVVQKDSIAHIVRYNTEQQTGYVIFDATTTFPANSALLKDVSIPLIMMIDEIDENHIEVSIADPELLPPGQTSVFEIRGQWNVSNTLPALDTVIQTDSTTIFTLNHNNGKSYHLNLSLNCPDDATITLSPTPSGTYYAFNTLSSDKMLELTSNVIFQAGNSVILQQGFEASIGTQFLAQIGACPE